MNHHDDGKRAAKTAAEEGGIAPTRRELLRGLAMLPLLAAAGMALSRRAPGAAPATPQAANLTDKDRADIARAETYLNAITTMRARFQQYSDNSGLAYGRIFLRRPGRIRVEYDPPVEALIVADGLVVTYYDVELDQINQIPIGSSPLWFLLRDKVSFSKGVTVSGIERGPGVLHISVFESDSPESGQITLVFADNPLELKQWTVIDPQGNQVRVGLQDVSLGGALANALFATPSTKRQSERR